MKQLQRIGLALLCLVQGALALWVVVLGFAYGFVRSSCSSPDSAPCNTELGAAGQTVMIAGSLLVAAIGTLFALRLNARDRTAWWIPAVGCVSILLLWWAGSSMVEASVSR